MIINYKKIDTFMIILIIFLPLLFISDGVSKYLTVQGSNPGRIFLMVRLLFEMIIIFYLLKNIKKDIAIYFGALGLLFVFFAVGQLSIGNDNDFIENFISFNKYIFLFLVYIFLKKILYLSEEKRNFVYKILTFLFIVNIIFIFIGFIFEISFFESFYNMDYRFGYDGIFLAGNEASFVLISMISFFYFKTFYEDGSLLLLLASISASLLSGMKAVYIYLSLLAVFHIIFKMKKKYFVLLIPLSVYASGFAIEYIKSEQFQILISFFLKIYEEEGLFYMLLSGRNEILAHESNLVMKDWSLINYLFGGRDTVKYIMEMDFFDLILFFGGVGSLIYIYLFYKFFIQKLLWHKYLTFFIFSILILAFWGGHFLTSAVTATYFTLVVLYFQSYRLEQK